MKNPDFGINSGLVSTLNITRKHTDNSRRRTRHRALILAAAFAFALVSGASRVVCAGDHTRPQQAQAQKSADSPLLAQADEVLQEMSKLTGLPIKGQVNKKVASREEIRKLLLHNLHTDYTPKEIHVQEASLRAFGLVSKDFDLGSFLVSFYTEQAAGFYDPPTKTMYIADWIPADMQRMVLAHELTHALQDQNFGLERYMKAVKDDGDAEAARQAVVEGYATAAMFQSVLGETPLTSLPNFSAVLSPLIRQSMAEFPVFSKAPFFFRLQALFPYIQGAGFIEKGLVRGDWKSLNELFTSPPTSTKAIYQPEVYFDHTPLPVIQLPRKTPLDSVHGLKLLDENLMGELGFNELLGQFLSEDKATADCANWMGDRYLVYEDPARESYALVVRTRWASPDAALTFFRDYHELLTKKYPELSPEAGSTDDLFIGHTASGEVVMLRAGDEVRWAEGVPVNKVGIVRKWLGNLQ
jgi:hypothetical protein